MKVNIDNILFSEKRLSPSEEMLALGVIKGKNFDEDYLKELTESIETHGLIVPPRVKREGDKYRVVLCSGNKRVECARKLGITEIEVIIHD